MYSSSMPRLALLGVAVFALNACDDSAGPPGSPPTMPPAASMQIDVTFFDGGAFASADQTGGLAGSSFIAAALAVGVARTATFLALAPPAATYLAALSQDPVFVDGAFHWQYSTSGSGYSYQVDLSAEPVGSQSFWEMRVTSATHVPPLNDFLWVSGTASLAADQGVWHLFDESNPGTPTEIIRVEWTYESESNKSLILTNVSAASADVGDRLEFSVNGDINTVRFNDASAGTEAVVQWNSVTNAGFIEAPNVNGGVRACWNANLENTVCTS